MLQIVTWVNLSLAHVTVAIQFKYSNVVNSRILGLKNAFLCTVTYTALSLDRRIFFFGFSVKVFPISFLFSIVTPCLVVAIQPSKE